MLVLIQLYNCALIDLRKSSITSGGGGGSVFKTFLKDILNQNTVPWMT